MKLWDNMKKYFRRNGQDENVKVKKHFVEIEENQIKFSAAILIHTRLKPGDYVILAYDAEKEKMHIEKTEDMINGYKIGFKNEYSYIECSDFFKAFNIDCIEKREIIVDSFEENGFQFSCAQKRTPKPRTKKMFVIFRKSQSRMMLNIWTCRYLKIDGAGHRLKMRYNPDSGMVRISKCLRGDINGRDVMWTKSSNAYSVSIGKICMEFGWEKQTEKIELKKIRADVPTLEFKAPVISS